MVGGPFGRLVVLAGLKVSNYSIEYFSCNGKDRQSCQTWLRMRSRQSHMMQESDHVRPRQTQLLVLLYLFQIGLAYLAYLGHT